MGNKNIDIILRATKEVESRINRHFPNYRINATIDYPTLQFISRNKKVIKLDISNEEEEKEWVKIIITAENMYFTGKIK